MLKCAWNCNYELWTTIQHHCRHLEISTSLQTPKDCHHVEMLFPRHKNFQPPRKGTTYFRDLARFAQDVRKRVTTRCKNINMPLIDPVTMSSAGAQDPPPARPSLPIELLPTDFARIFSQAHPALQLSAYYLRFPALVADPVPTLLESLFPLALIQIAWAVICLPAVGTSSKPVKKAKPGASKKTMEVSSSKSLVSSN